jgi:hypothetical protein
VNDRFRVASPGPPVAQARHDVDDPRFAVDTDGMVDSDATVFRNP